MNALEIGRRFPVVLVSFAALLVGCGLGTPSTLEDVGQKAFSYNLNSIQPGIVYLEADGCPTLDPSKVHATLNGRPLTLVEPGGRAVLDDNKCDLPIWNETAPTPPSETTTVLEVSDDTETVRVTFDELTRPPAAALATGSSAARGQRVEVHFSSGHLDDRLAQVRFRPNSGAEQVWSVDSIVREADGGDSFAIPDDATLGDGQLFLDVTSDIRTHCEGDVICTQDTIAIEHGLASTHTFVSLTAAPIAFTISG